MSKRKGRRLGGELACILGFGGVARRRGFAASRYPLHFKRQPAKQIECLETRECDINLDII